VQLAKTVDRERRVSAGNVSIDWNPVDRSPNNAATTPDKGDKSNWRTALMGQEKAINNSQHAEQLSKHVTQAISVK